MDIAALVTPKDLYIRNVAWAAGLAQPVNLDVSYTPYGFVFPGNHSQIAIDGLNTKQLDAMPAGNVRFAILGHDNVLRYGRMCPEWWSLNVVPATQRFYCYADEAESHYLATMINLMSSEVIDPELQLKDSPLQLIRRLRKHWPLVGDYLKFSRADIVRELHKRFPTPEEMHFHSQFTRVLKD